jgi:hypothetical protein
LLHDQLNVLGLKTRVVDFFVVIFVLLLLVLGSLPLAVVVIVIVVVARVIVRTSLGGGELLGSGGLGLRVQILNLGLAEDAGARE